MNLLVSKRSPQWNLLVHKVVKRRSKSSKLVNHLLAGNSPVHQEVAAAAMKRPGKGKGKRKRARSPSASSCQTEHTEISSCGDDDLGEAEEKLAGKKLPKSSSLFDFADYLVEFILTQSEKDSLANYEYTFAELGAGYATGTMCAESLKRAFFKQGCTVHGSCQFYTEQVDWKRDFIKNHIHQLVAPTQPCHMFINTGDLSKPTLITDEKKVLRRLPSHKFAFFAIECDDISLCSSTPRSVVDPEGKSGASLLEFLQYLESLKFHDRPEGMMIECVTNLDHVRKKVGGERGTDVVSKLLSELGYVSSWQTLNAQDFFLPQARPRIYGIFLKMRGLGVAGRDVRQRDLEQIWQFVKRCKTKPAFERLETLLAGLLPHECTQEPAVARKKQRRASKPDAKWLQKHTQVKEKLGLCDTSQAHVSIAEFQNQAVELGLTDREVDACVVVLSHMMKSAELADWQSVLLVGNIGDSIDRLRFRENVFPCLLPGQKYLLLNKGALSLIRDRRLFPALQGIGLKEAECFGLSELSLAKLQDLAGNAFTANICASILLAFIQMK